MRTTGSATRKIACTLAAVGVGASLAGCSFFDVGEDEPEDKNDVTVSNANERAKGWWKALANGDAQGAFEYLSTGCQDWRIENSNELLTSYEQRIINGMAASSKSTDEIIGAMETTVEDLDDSKTVARISMTVDLDTIENFPALRWERSDSSGPDGESNQWYLDNCRPPFLKVTDDERSYRDEMDRDEQAYRDGMIEDNGNYNDGVEPGSPEDEGGDDGY